jgi:hypothetical protein
LRNSSRPERFVGGWLKGVPDGPETAPSEAWDAVRRTRLAAERTWLMISGIVLCLATVGLIAASA